MTASPCQVFFLPVALGQRLCIYYPPAVVPSPTDAARQTSSILHIHAFAEEMNKCRRMSALTASSLAAQGLGVLQMDLYGCGDSSGDFAQADWQIWQSDILAALDWLKQKHAGTLNLWADRLGALLALDFLDSHEEKIDQLLLCQPVLDGSDYLNQLDRVEMARNMLAGHSNDTKTLFNEHTTREIAGYELSPGLVTSIAQVQTANLTVPVRKIHWLELSRQTPAALTPKRQRFLDHWQKIGNPVQLQLLNGPAFWQTPEISVSGEWTAACTIPFKDLQ